MTSLFKSIIDVLFALVYESEIRISSIDDKINHIAVTTVSVNRKRKASSQPTVKKENLNG